VLMLSDVFGATPSNVAQKLNDGIETRLLAGVNLFLNQPIGKTQCLASTMRPSDGNH